MRVKAAHLQLIYEKLKADTKTVALPSIEAETKEYGNVWTSYKMQDPIGELIKDIFGKIERIEQSVAKEDRGRKPRQVVLAGENPTEVEYLTKLRGVAQVSAHSSSVCAYTPFLENLT